MISEHYSNEDILSELRMFVDLDEEDLQACLSQIEEVDENTLQIKVLDRTFQFDIELCSMEEIE